MSLFRPFLAALAGAALLAGAAAGADRPRSPFGVEAGLRMREGQPVLRVSFKVPDDADPAKVTAEFKDGVLTVRLAKSEQARPRSIDVKVA